LLSIPTSAGEFTGIAGIILATATGVWLPVGFTFMAAVIAWRVRDLSQVRRQRELRQAVRQRTEQLERGKMLDTSRDRIMQMLVSNQPLTPVLDAVARLIQDQISGALPVILLKQRLKQRAKGAGSGDFMVGSAPGLPGHWLTAIAEPHAVPFEVWRQRCEYERAGEEPAWRTFFTRLRGENSAGNFPVTIHSLPIGESGSAPVYGSLGAILLMHEKPPGGEAWEQILRVSARLAQLAVEHRRFCEDLDFQAHHDSLTGLANRTLFEEHLEDAILQAQEKRQRLAVLYIDLDGFKQINDRYSHRTGDVILTEAARRMDLALPPGDMVARIGGDEFNVLLAGIPDAPAAHELALRLLEAVRQPIPVGGHEVVITISIGIAIFPDDCADMKDSGAAASAVQRQADAAMYYAKNLGRNRVQAFAESVQVLDNVRMEQELLCALREGWFTVYYQPKFTAADELAGMEALIRMKHPRHGLILPGQFISIAEVSGLIVPIGAWVISEVCRQIAEWRRRNLKPVAIAVNVSAIQMARVDFAESVKACLALHGVPANCLELEVTESMLIDADSEENRQMQLLRKFGVSVSIDDFGTGYSSLSYLHRLQIDAVKLDQSFVQTIDSDEGAQCLLRAVIGVAHGLGLDVIAEGVETEAQRTQLVAAGCTVMQGYLFAHPGQPEMVEPLLAPYLLRPDSADGDVGRLYRSLAAAAEQSAPALVESR
jgi:diguanylate cyclase (GGDEF)-like protein